MIVKEGSVHSGSLTHSNHSHFACSSQDFKAFSKETKKQPHKDASKPFAERLKRLAKRQPEAEFSRTSTGGMVIQVKVDKRKVRGGVMRS